MSTAPPGPSRAQRLVVLALIVALPLFSLIPTIAGVLANDPPSHRFLGFGVFFEDQHQYATFMAQARAGSGPLMKDLMTSEPHPGRFLAMVPWIVGRVSAALGADEVACWVALQYLAATLLLVVAWIVAGRFTRTPTERLAAFLIATIVSGFDWIPWLLQRVGFHSFRVFNLTFDYHLNWSLTGCLALAMWSVAQVLLLALILVLDAHLRRPALSRGILVAALAGATWLAHPYTGTAAFALVVITPFVPALRSLWRLERPDGRVIARRALTLAPILLPIAAVAAYLRWASAGDPVVAAVMAHAQAFVAAFVLPDWILGYGVTLLLAVFGLRALATSSPEDADTTCELLLTWLATMSFMALSPAVAGYKLQFLVGLPLAIVAARGLTWLRERVPRLDSGMASPLVAAPLLLVLFTGNAVSTWQLATDARTNPLASASDDELDCLDAIRAMPPGVLLTEPRRGAIAAWKTLHPVACGHHFLTVDPGRKFDDAAAVLSPDTPEDRCHAILSQYAVRYVLLSPTDAPLDRAEGYRVVHASGGWRVVEVSPAPR